MFKTRKKWETLFSAEMDRDSTPSVTVTFMIALKQVSATKFEARPLIVVFMFHVLNKCFSFAYKTFIWYYWLELFELKLQIDWNHRVCCERARAARGHEVQVS